VARGPAGAGAGDCSGIAVERAAGQGGQARLQHFESQFKFCRLPSALLGAPQYISALLALPKPQAQTPTLSRVIRL
jgi:hypothetical protein